MIETEFYEKISLKSKDGSKIIPCTILFKVNSIEYNKTFVVYTDEHIKGKGMMQIFASELINDNNKLTLKDIESNEIYEYLKKYLNIFIKDLKLTELNIKLGKEEQEILKDVN